MTKKFQKLNEAFNITPEVISSSEELPKDLIENKKNSDPSNVDHIKRDYEYTRANLYSIIEKGQEALDKALEIATETESARSFEVVGQLIKNVSDTTDKLIDLQKKLGDLDKNKSIKGPTNVTNALFVGSTAELSKLLKRQKDTEETK